MSRFFIDNYAIDLAKESLTVSDVYDSKAILQSIENIILTVPGERVFEPEFGSILMSTVFRNITNQSGERLLDSLIASINKYETRVTVISKDCKLYVNSRENSISLSIPFIINKTKAYAQYTKKLSI
jgi:phage baseplate assembly protein W